MSWFFGTIAVLLLLDALRLRQRVRAMPQVESVDSPATENFVVVIGQGIEVSDDVVNQASNWAHSQSLDVLDLVPGNMVTLEILNLLQIVDPETYRQSPFTTGRTAGHVLLVKPDVLQRAGLADHHPADPVEFLRLAERVKRYASRTTEMAISPKLEFQPPDPNKRKAVLRETAGGVGNFLIAIQPVMLGFLALAPLVDWFWGTAALLTFQLQPLLALGGSAVRPNDLAVVTFFRLPIETWRWFETIIGRWQPEPTPDPVEVRRSTYDELLKDGLHRFFEPYRNTCPLCNSSKLIGHLNAWDQFQNKPGRFHLDRCLDCRHIFQNPRLSIDGLDFYYKDFYDGLWEAASERIFGFSATPYHVRAGWLKGRHEPRKWLDVGGGHGHFCCAASDVWPNTQFDCLDLTESVDEAVLRRWVTAGYRGLFPELACGLENQYDVVSMSHYLEHVRDPEAELAAAATVLCDDGYLLIEVPDPASRMGWILGRFWIHWFQPQHQHFLTVENLNLLFARYGFEAVEWHRGEAHVSVDFMSAVAVFLARIAPVPNRPWRPRPTTFTFVWYRLVWIVGTPLALTAWGCDKLLAPIFRRPGLSNFYRVLAQKKDKVGS